MKKEPKNVVIVNDFAYVQGGASKVAIDTANILSRKGCNVYFFCGETDITTKDVLLKSITVVSTGQVEALKDKSRLRGIRNGLYNKKAKKELEKLLHELDPEETIVHVHGWTKCLSSSVFKAIKKCNFEMVLTLHDYFYACPNGGFYNYGEDKICNLCPMSGRCLGSNCDSRNYAFKWYRVIRQFIQNKIVKLPKIINNVIAVSEFSWEILKPFFKKDINVAIIESPMDDNLNRRRVKIKSEAPFLFIGRVDQEKGVKLFCEATAVANVPAIVIGDGKMLNELKDEFPKIEFTGWLNRKDIRNRMEDARCVIFPSTCYETAGLSVISALSVGLPVIVSEKTAAREYVVDGKNGLLFKSNDKMDLVRKIKKMNLKKAVEMGKFAYDNYDAMRFSSTKYSEAIINFYSELLLRYIL